MLTTKGPGSGLSPTKMNDILGMTATDEIPADTVIYEKDLQ
jgi:sialic acid synthase SpsE